MDFWVPFHILDALRKARKNGIKVSDLEKEIEKIQHAQFRKPCLLLVGTRSRGDIYTSWHLHTPFGVFEFKEYPGGAGKAFTQITGKRIPRGKDAMKKIEALLIQASI